MPWWPLLTRSLALMTTLCACAITAWAQPLLGEVDPNWREDPVPPPPAYSTSGLIDIEMPVRSNVKMGLDPDTLVLNQQTGVVRYVVVARGPSAINASYEGIRCATGEYRVYARQTPGNPWNPSEDEDWKPMRGQSGVVVAHPLRLARDGLCVGTTLRRTAQDMVRELRTGNRSIYY